MKLWILMILGAVLVSGGCAASPKPQTAARPAPINHIVLMKLQDPSMTERLIDDSDALLGTIPSVISYFAGTHYDIGRDSVLRDYDVAVTLGFADEQGLREYVAHRQHLEFVARWKPRLAQLRVYDVGDPTP
jgi:stress responsive alpha/beta barrel protein